MRRSAEDFLRKLVDVLKEHNGEAKLYREGKIVNIPFLIAPIKEVIDNDEYSGFLSELETNEFQISFD